MPKRILDGVVTSNACDKTVTVLVTRRVKHTKYKKYVNIVKKYHAHDERNECAVGDHVSIGESSPISKTKCWIVLDNHSEMVGVQS
ncbi:MAG: 30S ribosomal protein S17 [Holosporaceae bacterium]|jgi:small subunit ribosomal protein S17|nr:30S ribosomal protein S17 [Holosporaceae bacterium]